MESVDFNLAGVEPRVTAILTALKTATLISAVDKTYILSLGNGTSSRASILNLGLVTQGHIEKARGM